MKTLLSVLLMTSLLSIVTSLVDPDLEDEIDPHDGPPPTIPPDELPRDTRPAPDCRLYPTRPNYFHCTRNLLRCMDKDSNICHDHCHRTCRRYCFSVYDRCLVRARSRGSYELESQCETKEDQCYDDCMRTCEKHCQPCRDMFHTCRICITSYEDSVRLPPEVRDYHEST